jgi:hypothetical protein
VASFLRFLPEREVDRAVGGLAPAAGVEDLTTRGRRSLHRLLNRVFELGLQTVLDGIEQRFLDA